MTAKACTGGDGNTRPERTQEQPINVGLDWVSVTFHVSASFEEVMQLIGLGNLEFEHHDFGHDTFTEHVRFSNIKLQRKKETTYQLYLSGQGCREYETLSRYSWLELFEILKEYCGAKFTRIDLAIDDFSDRHFDVDRIRDYLNEGCFVSRMSDWDEVRGRSRTAKKVLGDDYAFEIKTTKNIVYLGSMKSRLCIVFYDKKLEREAKGKESDGTWDNWTRTELRMSREYADQTAEMIMLHGQDLGKIAFGILKKNLRFVVKSGKDSNMRRRKDAPWWASYVGKVDKLPFTLKMPERTIERTKEWFLHSVAPSLAAIVAADGNTEFVNEALQEGNSRLTEKHGMMIEQAKTLKWEEIRKKMQEWDSGKMRGYETEWQKKKAQTKRPDFLTK